MVPDYLTNALVTQLEIVMCMPIDVNLVFSSEHLIEVQSPCLAGTTHNFCPDAEAICHNTTSALPYVCD